MFAQILTYVRTKELTTRGAVFSILGALVVLFAPFLIFGKISLDGDTIMYTYPAAYFLKTFPDGVLNMFSFGGYPVTAAFHIGYFSPIYRLFFAIFDFIFAYHFIIFLDYVAAALLTYYFIRCLGRSVHAALLGSLAFVLSQWGIYWMSSINLAHTMYLLPALLLSVLKLTERKWGYSVLIAAVVGLSLTYTHYQFILMALLFTGIFFLYLAFVNWKEKRNTVHILQSLGVFALSCGAGFLLGLPQFLRTFQFLPHSMRSVFSAELSVWYFDLIRFILPAFEIPGWSTQEFMPYVGIIPLFFALIAMWKIQGEEWGRYGKFFLWTFVAVLILTLKYSPLFWIVKHLPFIGHYFLQPSRFLYLGIFALAVLAAYGLDYLSTHAEVLSQKFKKNLAIVVGIFGGLLVVGNILYFAARGRLLSLVKEYFDKNLYGGTVGLPREYYHNLIEVMADKAFANVSLLTPSVVITFLSLLGLLFTLRYLQQRILFLNLAVLVSAVTLLLGMTTLGFGTRDILFEKAYFGEIISKREEGKADYRVFSYLVPFAQYQKILALNPDAQEAGFEFSREALLGNLHFFSQIPIVGGYEPIAPRRYQTLLYHLESVPSDMTEKGKNEDIARKVPFLSLMNAKYIVSPYVIQHDNFKFLAETKVTSFTVPLYLYENRDALPLSYTPETVVYLKEDTIDENFKIIAEAKGSFGKVTYIECDDCEKGAVASTGNSLRSVTVVRDVATSTEMTVEFGAPGWVVFNKTFIPGWTATLDGAETRIYYGNHAFQAIRVPTGKHSVSFSYSPVI